MKYNLKCNHIKHLMTDGRLYEIFSYLRKYVQNQTLFEWFNSQNYGANHTLSTYLKIRQNLAIFNDILKISNYMRFYVNCWF